MRVTWEGHTLKEALKSLETRFDVNNVKVVFDAAMLSEKGLTFLLGYRMKSTSAAVKAQFLDTECSQPSVGHVTDGKTRA